MNCIWPLAFETLWDDRGERQNQADLGLWGPPRTPASESPGTLVKDAGRQAPCQGWGVTQNLWA